MTQENENKLNDLNIKKAPAILLDSNVIFPYSLSPITISESESDMLASINSALATDRLIAIFHPIPKEEEFANLQLDISVSFFEKNKKKYSAIGTLVRVIKELKFPDGSHRILVRGIKRIDFYAFNVVENVDTITFKELENLDSQEDLDNIPAKILNLKLTFKELIRMHPALPEEMSIASHNITDGTRLADMIADSLPISNAEKILVLSRKSISERIDSATIIVNKELEILKVSMKIQAEVSSILGQNQKEFYLREQLNAIQRELKEETKNPDILELEEKYNSIALTEQADKVVAKELNRLEILPQAAPEYHIAFSYISWLLDMPWEKYSEDCLDIAHASKILNEDHYGLKDVKERILDYLAVLQLKGQSDSKAPILCLVGPPGVGKTSLGKSIARAMNREFIRMSLGGVRDEAEIRGHRRTYVGAMPGRIIQNMKKVGTCNPVFMLDEIDKLSRDFKGDPASALLEVLDPAQNGAFNDNYLEVDYDLSKVFFIATANVLDGIPKPLLDRMEIIRLSGYTMPEKSMIAKQYLVPRQLKNTGIKDYKIKIQTSAINELIDYYSREAGVRELERTIEQLCRKVARKIVANEEYPNSINGKLVKDFLGERKYLMDKAELFPPIGCATGLAWTSCGGVVLPIETIAIPGKGVLKLTGSLGKVMQESAEAAFTLIKSRADKLGIESSYFNDNDFHIHVPDGATPKDGPSAGITITLALYSLISKQSMMPKLAMTGEITLSEKVGAIGGVREKVIAALRAGMKTVMLPEDNRKDVNEIPVELANQLNIVFVKNLDEALKVAFSKEKK